MAGFVGELLVKVGVHPSGVRQGLSRAAREFQTFERSAATATWDAKGGAGGTGAETLSASASEQHEDCHEEDGEHDDDAERDAAGVRARAAVRARVRGTPDRAFALGAGYRVHGRRGCG